MKSTALQNSRLLALYLNYRKKINSLLLILVLFLFGEMLLGGYFQIGTVLQIAKIAAVIGIFAICQMVIMAVGQGVDLSTGHIATIAAVISVTLIDGQNSNILAGFVVALLVGAAFGLGNGLGVIYLKVPSLLMTLAMGTIITGVMNIYTSGRMITGRAAPLMETWFAQQSWGIIPNLLIVWAVLGVVVMLVIYRTRWGSVLLGTGENPVAAELSGTNTRMVTIVAFIVSGTVAGFSGFVLLGYIGRVMTNLGFRYMLPSIAACVVGGVSIWGGEADYSNVMIGAMIMETVRITLYVLGFGAAARYFTYGTVLVVMLIIYARNKRK